MQVERGRWRGVSGGGGNRGSRGALGGVRGLSALVCGGGCGRMNGNWLLGGRNYAVEKIIP